MSEKRHRARNAAVVVLVILALAALAVCLHPVTVGEQTARWMLF